MIVAAGLVNAALNPELLAAASPCAGRETCPGRGAAKAMRSIVRLHAAPQSRDPCASMGPGQRRTTPKSGVLRSIRDTITSASPQQLIEPVAQLVLVIGFCQSRQIELRALGQLGVAGG